MLDVVRPTPTPTPIGTEPKLAVLSLEFWLFVPFAMDTEFGVCWPLEGTFGNFENVHWFTRKTAIIYCWSHKLSRQNFSGVFSIIFGSRESLLLCILTAVAAAAAAALGAANLYGSALVRPSGARVVYFSHTSLAAGQQQQQQQRDSKVACLKRPHVTRAIFENSHWVLWHFAKIAHVAHAPIKRAPMGARSGHKPNDNEFISQTLCHSLLSSTIKCICSRARACLDSFKKA